MEKRLVPEHLGQLTGHVRNANAVSTPLTTEKLCKAGWVVQWYNVGPWPACFRCPALGLQLMGDHLCG